MRSVPLVLNVLCLLATGALGGLVNFFPAPPSNSKPIPGGSPVSQCDVSESQLLELSSLHLTPNPPVRGKNVTITAVGDLLDEVDEGAYVDVEVRLGYIKLLTQTFDLCETLEDNDVGGLTCPLSAGHYSVQKEVEIPAEVPPGKYVVLARAYNVDDELITCLTGEIVFPSTGGAQLSKLRHKLY